MIFKDKIRNNKIFKLIMWFLLTILFIIGLYASQKITQAVIADEKGPFVIYLDVQNAKEFAENGVGIYAYNSATEKDSSVPAQMRPSDMGKGIYEYTFDRKWKYVAFTGGYGSWNYELATLPVNIEWEHNTPCFVLAKSDGTNTRGVWRNLSSTLYFDASLIKNKKVFVENGVYVCAYEEIENSDGLVVVQKPAMMQQSEKGEDIYEYTFDRPYSIVRFMLGNTTDAEPASDLVNIDWSGYASPCYRMTLPDSYEDVEPEETTTEETLTEESSVEESETKESESEESSVEESVTEESSVEESVTEESTVEESVTGGSVTEESTVEESVTGESATGESSVEESSAVESSTELPETETSTAEEQPATETSEAIESVVEPTTTEVSTESESSADEPSAIEYPETSEGAMSEEYSEEMQSVKSVTKWVKSALTGQDSRTVFRVTENQTSLEEPLENASVNESASTVESSSQAEQESTSENESQKEPENTSENSSEGEPESTSEKSSADEPESASEGESEGEPESSSEGETGGDPDGELYDIDADTLVYAEVAALAIPRSADTERTIYFEVCGNNDSTNGWTENAQIYIHYTGNTSALPVPMTRSERTCEHGKKLWEYSVPTSCDMIIFVSQSFWPPADNTSPQTVDGVLADLGVPQDDLYPCFILDGGYDSGQKGKKTFRYVGSLGPETMAGETMYFYDVANKVAGNALPVEAYFSNSSMTDTKVESTGGGYTIPDDATVGSDSVPYDTVQFKNHLGGNLGEAWNFIDYTGTSTNGFLFDKDTKNTFYYAATEKADSTIISGWGIKPGDANESLGGKTLYFDKLHFQTKKGGTAKTGKLQIGDSAPITLGTPADDSSTFCYTFPDATTATQQTVLTFIDEEGTKYHFRWTDFGTSPDDINMVTLNNSIASVSKTYSKAVTVYFDATYSKLQYYSVDIGTTNDYSMPRFSSGKLYYYATGTDKVSLSGEMELVDPYTEDSRTWSDVYKIDLPDGYDKIIFSNYERADATSFNNHGETTYILEIPTDVANPCFYADTGDKTVYDGGTRDGYWDEVYTIRDAEAGKNSDIVNIKPDTLTREPSVLYVNTTFYDYYTDYELNGNNRDTYLVNNIAGGTQRNWVTFRQFDQALSDYYRQNNVDIPIYTGHFQPSSWGTPFNAIVATLDLYGHSDTNAFYSTNNSSYTINGGPASNGSDIFYRAAQGLVDSKLDNHALMMTAGSNKVAEPHFDEEFLLGNNSKNAVLGDVYHNVAFPFEQTDDDNDGVKYWCFDSANKTLVMKQDTGTNTYYLKDVTTSSDREWSRNVNSNSVSTGVYGFFPFNDGSSNTHANTYNYGFGAKLEFQFRLTEKGTVTNKYNAEIPITFEFSGDDDVWVFIDGELVLDVGGAHGVSTGRINFEDTDSSTAGYQITATVDQVKASAGNNLGGNNVQDSVSKTVTLDGTSATEHTLTMFYMERGMWESNMKISFNFPDENKLEVEKQVDKSDVNPIFQDLFDNKSLFTYHIETQATHYGEKEVTSSGTSVSPITFNDSFIGNTVEPSLVSNTFKWEDQKDGRNSVAHWYASEEDKTGAWRDFRYGIIHPVAGKGTLVDISDMSYLEFKFYYDYTDTPSLTNMYLQIVDQDGKVLGNKTDYLSGKTYGMPSMAGKQWVTVRIDLKLLDKDSGFDSTRVTMIKFGYNYPRDIYLDDFIFKPAAVASELTGFVVKQYDIPDYGSAKSGTMVIPKGVVYSSTTGTNGKIEYDEDNDGVPNDGDGTFVLQNGEVITFTNQFRRGSYIYLEEESNPLFETSYTMYENGQAVSSSNFKEGQKYVSNGTVNSLVDIQDTAVDDDRTEKVITEKDANDKIPNEGNNYSGNQPSDKETFVYRSYAVPDEEISTTKLRVVFTNKVKTGSVQIAKEMEYADESKEGMYTFKVTFTNVGGIALEDKPIEMLVQIQAGSSTIIDGIPIGTFYTIEEVGRPDNSNLSEVRVCGKDGNTNPSNMKIHTDTWTIEADITEDLADPSSLDTATFINTFEPKISATVIKDWKEEVLDTNGKVTSTELPEEKRPSSILVRLQRKPEGQPDNQYNFVRDKADNVLYNEIQLVPVYDYDADGNPKVDGNGNPIKVWKYTIDGLDEVVGYPNPAYDDISKYPKWIYRFVEIDESGKVLENGNVITLTDTSSNSGDFKVTYTPTGDAITAGTRDYTITNTLLGPVNLQIKKTSMQDSSVPIEDVEFNLMKLKDDGKTYEQVGDNQKTLSSGIATFKDLENGTYKLTEMKTASGYTLLKDSMIIVIDRKTDTYTYRMASESASQAKPFPADSFDSDTRTLTFEIQNAHNIVLPATGWNGLWKAVAIIGAMVLMVIVMLIRDERKRRRRRLRQKRRREGRPPNG